MKYLIIITTLILLNCADNITNNRYGSSNATAWCSVEKWNNGTVKEIYSLKDIVSYENQSSKIQIVSIDSTKGDSIFVSNIDKKFVIIDKPFSEEYTIAKYNTWYEYDMENFGYADLYVGGEEFEQCSE